MRRRAALAAVPAILGLCCAGTALGDEQQATRRGAAVFQKYCALCHGANATGDGRAARLHNPAPVNLTSSGVNDVYRELIIRRGGAALGRSPAMPPWNSELSDAQIRDVIAYLRSIGR